MRIVVLTSLAQLILSGLAAATSWHIKPEPIRVLRSTSSPGAGTAGHFQQLIDHANPSLGTFKQRYWWNTEYYGGPGSPIILQAPGEASVDAHYIDLSNYTLPGLLAQTNKGAVIVLEHRYWGDSSPVGFNFTAQNLQHLNLDNAIQDLVYFANNVKLPFDKHGKSKPSEAPWILTGCSYSGALSAWTHALAPGTFWAHQCGSAVVEAVSSFWQYYSPIEQAMPRNCSADWKRIVSHVDTVLANGTTHEKQQLRVKLGFDKHSTEQDFLSDLIFWLADWQGHQLFSGYDQFFAYCDYIENQWPGSKAPHPGPDGVGLELAMEGFSHPAVEEKRKLRQSSLDRKEKSNPWDDADNHLWNWFLCNEPFEWWHVWGPGDDTGVVPQRVNRAGSLKTECVKWFPDVGDFQYGLKKGRTVDQVNAKTGGWNNVNTTRLVWVNSELDPWLGATVSWKGRPGGALQSTKQAPVHVIPGASHCSDFFTRNSLVNDDAAKIFAEVVSQMQEWVGEFYLEKNKTRPH